MLRKSLKEELNNVHSTGKLIELTVLLANAREQAEIEKASADAERQFEIDCHLQALNQMADEAFDRFKGYSEEPLENPINERANEQIANLDTCSSNHENSSCSTVGEGLSKLMNDFNVLDLNDRQVIKSINEQQISQPPNQQWSKLVQNSIEIESENDKKFDQTLVNNNSNRTSISSDHPEIKS